MVQIFKSFSLELCEVLNFLQYRFLQLSLLQIFDGRNLILIRNLVMWDVAGLPTIVIWSRLVKSLSSFLRASATLAKGSLVLKILVISYWVPRCSRSVGPFSFPWLLPSNQIFPFLNFVIQASGVTLFSICFKKPVLCWSMCSTVNLLLGLTWGASSVETLWDLDLEFFGLDHFTYTHHLQCPRP
jgi:hypothetical protein